MKDNSIIHQNLKNASPLVRADAIREIGRGKLNEFRNLLVESAIKEHWMVQAEAVRTLSIVDRAKAMEELPKIFFAAKPAVQEGIIQGLLEANGEKELHGLLIRLVENEYKKDKDPCLLGISDLAMDVVRTIREELRDKYLKLKENGGEWEKLEEIADILKLMLKIYGSMWRTSSEPIAEDFAATMCELGFEVKLKKTRLPSVEPAWTEEQKPKPEKKVQVRNEDIARNASASVETQIPEKKAPIERKDEKTGTKLHFDSRIIRHRHRTERKDGKTKRSQRPPVVEEVFRALSDPAFPAAEKVKLIKDIGKNPAVAAEFKKALKNIVNDCTSDLEVLIAAEWALEMVRGENAGRLQRKMNKKDEKFVGAQIAKTGTKDSVTGNLIQALGCKRPSLAYGEEMIEKADEIIEGMLGEPENYPIVLQMLYAAHTGKGAKSGMDGELAAILENEIVKRGKSNFGIIQGYFLEMGEKALSAPNETEKEGYAWFRRKLKTLYNKIQHRGES